MTTKTQKIASPKIGDNSKLHDEAVLVMQKLAGDALTAIEKSETLFGNAVGSIIKALVIAHEEGLLENRLGDAKLIGILDLTANIFVNASKKQRVHQFAVIAIAVFGFKDATGLSRPIKAAIVRGSMITNSLCKEGGSAAISFGTRKVGNGNFSTFRVNTKLAPSLMAAIDNSGDSGDKRVTTDQMNGEAIQKFAGYVKKTPSISESENADMFGQLKSIPLYNECLSRFSSAETIKDFSKAESELILSIFGSLVALFGHCDSSGKIVAGNVQITLDNYNKQDNG